MEKEIVYTPHGVCSRQIRVVIEDGVIKEAAFFRRMQREYAGHLRAGSGHVRG